MKSSKDNNSGFLLSRDNPFAVEWRNTLGPMKTRTQTLQIPSSSSKKRIEYIEEYSSTGVFCKLYMNKDLIEKLSNNACRLILTIAVRLDYNSEKILLKQETSGLSRRTFPKALQELLDNNVLSKEKRGRYWVNPTIIFKGKVEGIEGEDEG